MDFYRTKTKLYLEASFIIVCTKESVENKQKILMLYAYYEQVYNERVAVGD